MTTATLRRGEGGTAQPLFPPAVGDLLARGTDLAALQEQVTSVHGCEHPVRLAGRRDHLDSATGELTEVWSTAGLPDGVLHVACKNRRASRCEPCSRLYQDDAWQLIAAGLRGGKGAPDTVASHPAVFVTLTAPSFGHVHTRHLDSSGRPRHDRHGRPLPCRARRTLAGKTCEHGRPLTCTERHDGADPQLGQPLCADCFDYAGAVLWNAHASELWRRTRIDLYRQLAATQGITERQVKREVSIQYVKVAEYQRRGAIHFHLLIRLDAPTPSFSWPEGVPWRPPHRFDPPPPHYTADLLTEAIRGAVDRVAVPYPVRTSTPSEPAVQLDLLALLDQALASPTRSTAGQGPPVREADAAGTLDARTPPRPEHPGTRGPARAPYPADGRSVTRLHRFKSCAERIRLRPKVSAARWGSQVDIRPITAGLEGRHQAAGYLAKYATKHTEALGPLDRRLKLEHLPVLAVNGHVNRLVVACWLLSRVYPDLRLAQWSHQLGFGGHWLTKSRRYSTTFTRLRNARAVHQARHRLAGLLVDPFGWLATGNRSGRHTSWQLVGTGWRTAGDRLLASTARNTWRDARDAARTARHDDALARAT